MVGSGAGGGVDRRHPRPGRIEGRRARGRRLLRRVRLQPCSSSGPTRTSTTAAARCRRSTATSRCRPGRNLGGGTTINWTNCLRTTPWVREQWAREHGLEGVDGPEYDRHLDAVLERIGANEECCDFNGPTLRMKEGAEALGWSLRARRPQRRRRPPTRPRPPPTWASATSRAPSSRRPRPSSATRSRPAPRSSRGRPRSGSWSRAAAPPGSRRATWIPRAAARRRSRSAPRRSSSPAGRWSRRRCCCARRSAGRRSATTCGCIPAPPSSASTTRTSVPGGAPPHTGVVDEFADTGDGWGFLLETAQYTTGIGASAIPFTSAAEHKEALAEFRCGATSIALLRDRGARAGDDRRRRAGRCTTTRSPTRSTSRTPGRASTPRRGCTRRRERREIRALAAGLPRWRRGDDLDAFIGAAQRVPLRFGGLQAVLGPPDGQLPDGHRPGDERRRALGRAARHPRRLDRRRQRLPDLLAAPTR